MLHESQEVKVIGQLFCFSKLHGLAFWCSTVLCGLNGATSSQSFRRHRLLAKHAAVCHWVCSSLGWLGCSSRCHRRCSWDRRNQGCKLLLFRILPSDNWSVWRNKIFFIGNGFKILETKSTPTVHEHMVKRGQMYDHGLLIGSAQGGRISSFWN